MIFFMSSQSGDESAVSSNIAADLIYRLYVLAAGNGEVMNETDFMMRFVSIIRQMAHFVEFMILGILTVMTFKEYSFKKTICAAIIFCILYAISDEVHQLFVPNRYCSIEDMLIDTAGSITGIFLYHLFRR